MGKYLARGQDVRTGRFVSVLRFKSSDFLSVASL